METKVTPPPTRKPRGFKIALIVLAALFLLFAAALVLLPYFLPVDTIRSIARTQARDLAGVDLNFESLGFSWNGSVVLNGISVAPLQEDGTPGETLLTVEEGRANVGLLPLLSGKITVYSVTASGFSLRIARDVNGDLNLPLMLLASRTGTPALLPPDGDGVRRIRLSALAAEPAAQKLPPIELHRVDLRNGTLIYEDAIEELALDFGVDFVRIDGGDINEPFLLSGRLLPYPRAHDKGEITFTGRAALVNDYAFNPQGEALLEAEINAFSLHELADAAGFGDILASGELSGSVRAAYTAGTGALTVTDMRFSRGSVGIGPDSSLTIPDSTAGLQVQFDPETGTADIAEMSLSNHLFTLRGRGRVSEVYSLADGVLPSAAFDFTGITDFAGAAVYLAEQGLSPDGLPELEGSSRFAGQAVLEPPAPGEALSPVLTLEFQEGSLGARDAGTGIAVSAGLEGISLRAAAGIGDALRAALSVALGDVPVQASVPQLGPDPVSIAVSGGLAAELAGGDISGELRLNDTRVSVPPTPWADALTIVTPETRVTFDLARDALTVQDTTFTINDIIRGGVQSAAVTGLVSGSLKGEAVVNIQAALEQAQPLFRQVIPELVNSASGAVRGAARIRLDGTAAEAVAQGEIDNLGAVIDLREEGVRAQFASPKASAVVHFGLDMTSPLAVTINSLEVRSDGSSVRAAGPDGFSMAGSFGGAALRAAGRLDAEAQVLHLSGLAAGLSGMNTVLGRNGVQTAGFSSGTLQLQGPTPEQPLSAPLAAQGDFSVPLLDMGAENLVFYRDNNGQREDSSFGTIRAQLGADGYIGPDKPQIINLRTATLQSGIIGASSRGQADLGTGAVAAEYAAVMAPAGMSSLLVYLGLPPALLQNVDVRGNFSWDGREVKSLGETKGQLRLASGEINPFAMAHDLSASADFAAKTLAVTIRRLDGAVSTAEGQAVASVAAQPSSLLLSRGGSQGSVDIRINGAAAPTRQLLLGVIGVVPQLSQYSSLLYQAQADGVYQAWLQVKEEGPSALGLNLGGEWQGAALSIGGTPFLAEAQKLSAALVGTVSLAENRIDISRMLMRSDSAQMQAEGSAQALLAMDGDDSIAGLENVGLNLSFVMGDLTRLPRVFPGIVPGDLGLTGRMDGTFRAAGSANDIRITDSAVRFQGFQVSPGGLELAVPSGAASLEAGMSLNLGNAGGPPSDFEFLRLFNITGGRASLSGAQFQDKPVDDMSGTFDLQGGVLTLHSAQLSIGGGAAGSARAAGTVDFRGTDPAVSLRVAARNISMALVNNEISQFARIESGAVNLPAAEGQSAGIAFTGIDTDDILRTLSLENFSFVTSPVVLYTGPVLNAQLDSAAALMRMDRKEDNSRMISLQSISGTVHAGQGGIHIIEDSPINVIGDNTADFRVWGHVDSDETMRINLALVGKLENINRLLSPLNSSASRGNYRVRLEGTIHNPEIAGIGSLAAQLMKDMALQGVVGGALDLGKEAPKAVLDAAGAILSGTGDVITSPENILKAPENVLKGVGRAFGIGRSRGDEDEAEDYEEDPPAEEQDGSRPRLRLPFGR